MQTKKRVRVTEAMVTAGAKAGLAVSGSVYNTRPSSDAHRHKSIRAVVRAIIRAALAKARVP